MPEPDSLREFEFLPNLPKSNLDDRAFEDLVQECILRIPRYCPEWTNHNPGDPGITLIELFSWLVKQMLSRFNQVPRRNYVAFLELLGIRLLPPTPASVDITFHLIKSQNSPLRIPINTEVATVRTETEPAIVFTTDAPLTIGQPQLRRFFTATQPETEPTVTNLHSPFRSLAPRDWTNLNEVYLFENCAIGNCFYLVLSPANVSSDDSIQGNIIALTFKGMPAGTTGITPENPPLRWEAWDGEEWRSHQILHQPQDDHTKGFSFHELRKEEFNLDQGADVILHLPQQWQETDFGHGDEYRGYWIRCVYIDDSRNPQNRYGYTPIVYLHLYTDLPLQEQHIPTNLPLPIADLQPVEIPEAHKRISVLENHSAGFVLGQAQFDQSPMVGGGKPYHFTVTLRPDHIEQVNRTRIENIIEQVKPAFCTYDLWIISFSAQSEAEPG